MLYRNLRRASLLSEPNIQYVGGKTFVRAGSTSATATSLTNLTGGIGTRPSAGDIIIVTNCVATQGRQPALSPPAGYTGLTVQRTTASIYDVNLAVAYKISDGTETAVGISSTGNADDAQCFVVQVFRGVDNSTPLDVTPTYATGTGSYSVNPAAITPVTPSNCIVICGGGAAGTAQSGLLTASYLTGVFSVTQDDVNRSHACCGYLLNMPASTYNGATFGGASSAPDGSWGCATIALRPA